MRLRRLRVLRRDLRLRDLRLLLDLRLRDRRLRDRRLLRPPDSLRREDLRLRDDLRRDRERVRRLERLLRDLVLVLWRGIFKCYKYKCWYIICKENFQTEYRNTIYIFFLEFLTIFKRMKNKIIL